MKYITVIVGAVLLLGCADNITTAARATLVARQLGDATDEAIVGATKAVTKNCLAKHGPKTDGYAKCVSEMLVVAKRWRDYALPVLNASISTAYRSIQLAKLAGEGKKEALAIAKKTLCMVVEVVSEFKGLLPESLQKYRVQINFALNLAKGATCP